MTESSPSQLKVEVVRTRFGPLQLALELKQISSVLDYREGHGLQLVDPAPRLGLRPLGGGHVGFVVAEIGPPVGVIIGEVQGFETWTASRIMALPKWLRNYLPDVLKPACGVDENGDIVWMLDLLSLTR
ncbi:hypothetical protein [Bradymonas sediminis]|uniref:Uncharacterized protein n=1 Tax=Bradymonas sediminis TaxID=1548548 RepID=A0A2Z4FQ34_9DELT|nr:hypothetical protein [Bradymonas sediminis]AWV91181.1 hypothetical protein DN745_18355 [Bradymonas sediminis]TDP73744.1 hypothetical protein DFR33_10576 [Bradymonas sediminis]